MEITRDEPGRVLELCAPTGSGRWREGLVALFLFPFLIVPLLMVFSTLSGASPLKSPWAARGVDRREEFMDFAVRLGADRSGGTGSGRRSSPSTTS